MATVRNNGLASPSSSSSLSPPCTSCGGATTQCITRTSNRNGNAGRPYLKCQSCLKFVTFVDQRGISSTNPKCECGKTSRIQVAGKVKGRGLHYVCQSGNCDFYEIAVGRGGKQITLTEKLVEDLARIFI